MAVAVTWAARHVGWMTDLIDRVAATADRMDGVRRRSRSGLGLPDRQHLDPLPSGSDRTHAGQRPGEQQRGVPIVGPEGLPALFRRGLFVAEALPLRPSGGQLIIGGGTNLRAND